jgi:hypothetical protein
MDQPRVCCTVSIPFASLPAHAMMDVWICSFYVLLACVGMDASGAGFAASPLGKPAPHAHWTAEIKPA